MSEGLGLCEDRLQAGDRVTDCTDWRHATVLPPGEYTSTIVQRVCPPMVSLQYDDLGRRDFVPVSRLIP